MMAMELRLDVVVVVVFVVSFVDADDLYRLDRSSNMRRFVPTGSVASAGVGKCHCVCLA